MNSIIDNVIEVNNLKKYFGNIRAVDEISFSVKQGSFFAFLGLNGAGKSTTINILCSILAKDSGRIVICGLDIEKESEKIKNKIGIVFQDSVLDEQLSVEDNLKIKASFYGLRGNAFKERLAELTAFLKFDDLLKRPYGKLSGGQKRRIDIARGILNYPKILILDEPTTGLDPQTRKDVWNALLDLRKKNNMTIFYTTHYMEEANKADNVVIMDGGKIVANDTPNNLKNIYSGDYIILYLNEDNELNKSLKENKYPFVYDKDAYRIKVPNLKTAKDFIIKYQKYTNDFEIIKGNMDDVFLNATGKKLSESIL